MPQIHVPPGIAVDLIARVLAVQAEGRLALRARIRQLADMGVPRMGRGKPHERLRYGLVELTELAIGLLLTNAGMPPATAARYVREYWHRFAPLALAGIGPMMPASYTQRRRPRALGPIAVIEGNMLQELGKRGIRAAAVDVPLPDVVIHHHATSLSGAFGPIAAGLAINAAAFMPALVQELSKFAIIDEDLIHSLDALRVSEKTRSTE